MKALAKSFSTSQFIQKIFSKISKVINGKTKILKIYPFLKILRILSQCYYARTHARLESNDASHVCTTGSLQPRTMFLRLRNSTQSQLERARRTTVQKQYTHTYILNIRITVGDDYDRGCTKNTLTALYTTDQQHVLACGTYLPRNNHRKEGR